MFLLVISCGAAQASTLYSSVRKGVDLFEQQQYEEALTTLLDAQVVNPESAVLKFDIASCQYKLQKYEEAATGYLDVVATAQDAQLEAKALYNLGNTMYRQGKLEDAVEYYKKTLELDPEDEDARKNLEFVREEIKRRMNEAKDTQQRRQEDQQKDQQDQQSPQSPQSPQSQQSQQDQQSQKASEQQSPQDDSRESPQDGSQQQAGAAGQKEGPQGNEDLRDIAGAARPMSEEEAEQWLRGLEENRDKLQQFRRQTQPGQPRRPGKDW